MGFRGLAHRGDDPFRFGDVFLIEVHRDKDRHPRQEAEPADGFLLIRVQVEVPQRTLLGESGDRTPQHGLFALLHLALRSL